MRLHRRRLDREIVRGHVDHERPALALRERQLIDPAAQRRLARYLRDIVKHVERHGSSLSAVVIDRQAVWAARHAIFGLAERLDSAGPVTPRGMVMATALITDGGLSPVYGQSSGRRVAEAIWEISDALGKGPDDLDASVDV